jgi:hypothetical protein
MPTAQPLPWLDHSLDGHKLRVLVNGPDVAVYLTTEPTVDLVHVRDGRTRSLVLLNESELVDELAAIARGERTPPPNTDDAP